MYSQTPNQCDTIIYTQYTVQNSTVSTPESISFKKRGEKTQKVEDNFQG